MSFEDDYLAARKALELETDKFVESLKPLVPRLTALESGYELIDASIFHILRPAKQETRNQLARSAFRNLLLNRNVDHVPAYAGKLCDYLNLVDPDAVLDRALRGESFLFAGFHTGPYWSIFQSFVKIGVDVTTLLPESLASKREEISDVFAAATKHTGSKSTLELIRLDDPNFLIRVRSSNAAGRQLVVFLDGYSGAPTKRNERRDVELDFFHSRITVKTTILRLADILGLPLVTFNAVREEISRTLYLDPPMQKGNNEQYDEVARIVYDRLLRRLQQEPAQWEGWLYFHNYFSPGFRSSLGLQVQPTIWPTLEKASRFVIQAQGNQNIIFDKQTYRHYQVNKLQGAQI